MRDDITSIPISEVFEEKSGCPICRLRNILEERTVKYITGAAMMEPDIRIETNKKGFCNLHYKQMIENGPKLSVALILQSHIEHLTNTKYLTSPKSQLSCYVCDKLNHNMTQILNNLCVLWERKMDFRTLFNCQEFICLEHCKELINVSGKISKRKRKDFIDATVELAQKKANLLTKELKEFCYMFDYRSGGKASENAKKSPENSIEWLTTRKI